jgi:hypothetical protein
MFTCPNCSAEAKRLVAYNEPKYLGCDACGTPKKKFSNCNIGQVVDKWESTSTGKTMRLTHGKNWEMERRQLADDGKTVINIDTGKETQY